MPTYDYQCDACGNSWELFQKITDEPIKKCPHCGKKKAVRLFGTGAALMFKGSGFYETDYRSDSYKKGAKADNSGGKSSESSDTKSTEKPATSQSTAKTSDSPAEKKNKKIES